MEESLDREAVIQALKQFDGELRPTLTWQKWENRYDYAIDVGGRRYPAKQIFSLATGRSTDSFSGGEQTNRPLERLGFKVVKLDDLPKSDGGGVGTEIGERLNHILHLYKQTRTSKQFGVDEDIWGIFGEVQNLFENSSPIRQRPQIAVTWGVGKGNWAKVPWVAFLDERATTKITSGIYGVLLFREDLSGVYMTLNQGVTQPKKQLGTADGLKWLRENATKLRGQCNELSERDFRVDGGIDLRAGSGLGKDYESSTIAHKLYPLDGIPDDSVILSDLEAVLSAYERALEIDGLDDQVDELTTSLSQRVWLVAPGRNAEHWDEFYREGLIGIGWEGVGDLSSFDSIEATKQALLATGTYETDPVNDARACYEFAHEMKPGDLILAKKGRSTIVGHGIITGEYIHDPNQSYYNNTRSVRWEGRGEWAYPGNLVLKTVTEIGKYPKHVDELKRLIGLIDEGPEVAPETERQPFGLDDALAGLFMSAAEAQGILKLWQRKKNLILQGPPGVGKTFVARRLAYALMGFRDPSRLGMVQFHQSYAYEDFIQGYRPSGEGFSLKDGVFYEFCERAKRDQKNRYVFVIDEVNRGNLSKIFGELLMLIEGDKRGSEWSIPLTYASSSEAQFFVPENLYLLGMMNTADRSLAVVDYALRRRFGFVSLTPKYSDKKFRSFLDDAGVPAALATKLIERMTDLNRVIAEDAINLGPGFQIGHSFFTPAVGDGPFDAEWYRQIVESEILPLLEEYWFEMPDLVLDWHDRLLD